MDALMTGTCCRSVEDEAEGWDLASWCRAGLSLAVTATAFGCALLLLPALLLMYSGNVHGASRASD